MSLSLHLGHIVRRQRSSIITPTVQKLSIVQTYNSVISLKLIYLNFVVVPRQSCSPPGIVDSGPPLLSLTGRYGVSTTPRHCKKAGTWNILITA
jgi:hypothetical protein